MIISASDSPMTHPSDSDSNELKMEVVPGFEIAAYQFIEFTHANEEQTHHLFDKYQLFQIIIP